MTHSSTSAATTLPADPRLDRLRRALAALVEHQDAPCKCLKGKLHYQDSYSHEEDLVKRIWACAHCNRKYEALGIPINWWQTSTQKQWEVKAAAQRARRKKIRCPCCGNESIAATGDEIDGLGAYTHVRLTCAIPGCTFGERLVERSIGQTAVAVIRRALLLVVVIVGALVVALALKLSYCSIDSDEKDEVSPTIALGRSDHGAQEPNEPVSVATLLKVDNQLRFDIKEGQQQHDELIAYYRDANDSAFLELEEILAAPGAAAIYLVAPAGWESRCFAARWTSPIPQSA
jgi:hypothetical protein